MSRVKGKVAIVTGGAAGIGHSACMLLAQEGAKVAVADIDIEAGKKTAAAIRKNGGTAEFWEMNTAKEKQVMQVMRQIAKKWGKVDVLVNNAGILGVNKPTHEVTEREWDQVQAVNVKGVFLCTKHVIPHMKKAKGGSIINLSSIYGLVGSASVSPYHASKGAVRLMTKTDAMLYAKNKIRVNSIHPGITLTSMLEKTHKAKLKAFVASMKSLYPLGRAGQPEDIGWGIVYLASDESSFVTGSELVIDGGYTAK